MTLIRRFLATLAVASILTACHAVVTYWPVPYPDTDFEYVCSEFSKEISDDFDTERRWNDVCLMLQRPVIVESSIVKEFDSVYSIIRGLYYKDEPYIFVRPDMTLKQKTQTIQHEMVHYVIYALGFDYDTCEHERIARKISGGPWDISTKSLYGCN
jgi:hypothetical protein